MQTKKKKIKIKCVYCSKEYIQNGSNVSRDSDVTYVTIDSKDNEQILK